jgi:signal transduction histidine kinase/ligand-binding sensor domain-containing protein
MPLFYRMKLLFILFFNVLFTCVLHSQENILHFTTVNGLPHDITYGIFQDKDGFIWIGTDDGLVKYDGQEFKLFSTDEGLRSNFVIAINQARNGDILVGTWGGGLHVIRDDKIIPTPIPEDESEKINNLQVWNDDVIVKNPKGNFLYEKTANGYIKKKLSFNNNSINNDPINQKKKTSYYLTILNNIPYFINDIKPFYISGIEEKPGIFQFKNKKVQSLHPYFLKKTVNSISTIGENKFVVTVYDSLYFLHNNIIEKKVGLNIKPENQFVCKVKPYNANEYIILVSDTKGYKKAYMYDKSFTKKTDLSHLLNIKSTVSDFIIDYEKNIWITTNGGGVYCYNKNATKFKNIAGSQLPETLILDIDELNKTNYFLTPNYLIINNKENSFRKIKINGVGKKLSIIENDSLIINSLQLKNGIKKDKIKEINGYNLIYLKDQKKILINDNINIEYLNKKISNYKGIVYDALIYNDTLWFATNIGTSYYEAKEDRIIKKWINGKKLLSDHVRKLTFYNDKLWIATNKGLNIIQKNSIESFTQKNGLISNQINCMIVDHKGKLWLGTNKGISIFDGKNFINITTSKGLLSSFINTLFENSKNEVLVGSDKGITIINNNTPLKLENAPLIHCQQKESKFAYTIISYNRSNSLTVEYKLNDLSWITLNSPKGILDFGKEKKGNYKLQLRAKKQDGIWGYSPVYSFTITIPWHKDIKYIVLLILLISGIIIFFILNQLQKVKKRNNDLKDSLLRQKQLEDELTEVRTNIAQDFHDDLGNKLARISLLSNLAKEEVSKENSKLKTRIEQIEIDAGYLYKGTKDFIFSLNDESNYLEELVTYLSDFGEEFFTDSNIKFKVEKTIKYNSKLPYYWSKQLIYIFKEALTNAYKHSKSDLVIFSFDYDGNTLTIMCRDNGSGIKKTDSKASNGLSNMTKRAEKLGGKLEILFEKNTGTTVLFVAQTTLKGS